MAHRRWLARQKFEHAAQQIVFQEKIDAIEDALSGYIGSRSNWRRRADLVHGAGRRSLSGDARRLIPGRCNLCGRDRRCAPLRYASRTDGLPRPSSGGALDRRHGPPVGRDARRQSTRAPRPGRSGLDLPLPRQGQRDPEARLEGLPKAVRDIAWKAQVRLCARYRRLSATGKKPPVVVAAIAREMAAFLWAIGREVAPS